MGNKHRKARGRIKPADVPLDKARSVAKLTQLKGRGVEIAFVPSGIIVEAETPAEMERETDKEIAKRAGDDRN